jgi:hypothetical protein
MNNLKIHKKIVPHVEGSKAGDFLESAAFVVVGILCSPLILIAWLAIVASNAQAEKISVSKELTKNWFLIDTPGDFEFTLRYEPIDPGSISEAAAGFFDIEQLHLYETVPPIKFFDGYFTSFKIEQSDGIFVQKVFFDKELEEVISMPLYFFDYQTTEAEEIHDLKDYVLSDSKGNPNDFLLTASGEEHDLEIRITRS